LRQDQTQNGTKNQHQGKWPLAAGGFLFWIVMQGHFGSHRENTPHIAAKAVPDESF